MADSDRTVDFGFEKVAAVDKAARVRAVFASVAAKYDVMNDLMSFGAHRLWKQFTLSLTGLRPGQSALDVAGGTGDLAKGLLAAGGQVRAGGAVGCQSRDAGYRPRPIAGCGIRGQCRMHRCRCASAAFQDNTFDCVTIGFGLRNVTDKAAALKSMHRVLKPGGQLLVLEFSTPVLPGLKSDLRRLFLQGAAAAGQTGRAGRASYRYLAESIRMHPESGNLARDVAHRRVRRRRAITI